MSENIKELQQEIETIKQRNKRVEADKAWEISLFRLTVLSIATFIFSITVLYFVKAEEYLLGALSSTAGLIISSQSLPFIKKWWIKNRYAC
jgi:hypothetical protein